MPRQITAEDYRVRAGFEALRQKLLDEQFANRLDRPLAYWALPADRRLPLILLGRTLRELLQLPYEEISDTPGVGLKKLGMLLTLLARATHDQPPQAEVAPSAAENVDATAPEFATHDQNGLDPAFVSEQSWERWCETVRQHGLGQEKLGRLAPSLQELPTVICLGGIRRRSPVEFRSSESPRRRGLGTPSSVTRAERARGSPTLTVRFKLPSATKTGGLLARIAGLLTPAPIAPVSDVKTMLSK